MAVAGNKPKTIDLARLAGMQPSDVAKKIAKQEIEFPPIEVSPDPPDWMLPFDFAVETWDTIAPTMVKHKLLTEANAGMLAIMCCTYHQLVTSFRGDSVFNTSNMGLIAQYRMLMSEFGLTPSSQVRAHSALDGGGASATNAFTKNKR